ncbi:L-type lectin-domain containing receptor kinase IX.1, partial [Ananas comosus]
VLLSFDGNPNDASPVNLTHLVDLKAILPQEVIVGFSAASSAVELHQILYWNFNSTFERKSNRTITSPPTQPVPPSSTYSGRSNVGVEAGSAAGVVALLCLVAAICWFLSSRKKATVAAEEEGNMDDADDPIDDEFEKGRGPQRFPYSELVAAANNFDGGFGFVYKGFLRSANLPVAIKRISKGSEQGLKEYTSEINTISRLRHRNLVQLIGWCHRRGDFLLVYELMPNGSLDSYLYSKERLLPWSARYNIAQGLASALLYLHTEWEQCVVHRDIKPSNIMLDASFGAKLGDFGLARLVDHDRGSQTTVPAGTLGYLAPECFITGKASKETDIFSFGVVLLEIACGRKCLVQTEFRSKVSLVEWVWSLYGRKSVLEAADERLNGNFEEPEMERLMVVGLWCAHPDYNRRPTIQQAIGVLRFEIPSPALPPNMPELMFAPLMDLSNFNYTSSSSTGASACAVSCFLSLFCCITIFHLIIPPATPLSFSFNFSDPKINMSLIQLQADAVWNRTVINLSKDSSDSISNSQGRAVYSNPVLLWDDATGEVASFHTSFSFIIQATDASAYGDGLAFFLSPSPSVVPRFDGGGYLGLFDNGTALNSTQNQLVAVEFDTFKNDWDPSACHVGIDINSINSTVYEDLPNITRSGTRATASIVYDNTTKYLSVLLSYDGNPNYTKSFSLSCLVDLKAILPQEVTVGFSAATGGAVELHQILYWNFNSTLERKSNLMITSPPTQPTSPPTQPALRVD